MRAVLVVPFLVCAAALAGCGSDDGATGGGGLRTDGPVEIVDDAAPVTGEVKVLLRTWNPNAPERGPNSFGIVNASSEVGAALSTGRTTSEVWRVLQDAEMGNLLATLDANGFSGVARDGVTAKSHTDDPTLRGLIVIERDGQSKGLEYVLPATSSAAEVYRKCRDIILRTHHELFGLGARVAPGAADESQFQVPERIKLRR